MAQQKAKIVVVDDNPVNRYTVSKVLEKAGYTVLQADTGSGALELAKQSPDLMILDIQLPDILGYDVCEKIKREPAMSSIIVLLLSAAFTKGQDRAYGLEHGADGYLTHPLEPQVLLATVHSLLRARTAEEESRVSTARLNMAMTAARMGAFDWDLTTGKVIWNDELKRLWGYEPKEWRDDIQLFWDRVHPEDRERVSDAIRATVQGGAHFFIEYRVVLPRGTTRWILAQGQALTKATGRTLRLVGTAQDVTQVKELESRLKGAIRDRDEVLSIVSHDLKNPLSTIELNASMLIQAEAEKITPEMVKKRSEQIRRAARRMNSLISDLLDISRIEAGRLTLEPGEWELGHLVRKAMEDLHSLAEDKKIRLEADMPCGQERVACDYERMAQVFGNIVGNAIKFVPPETGHVRIGAEIGPEDVIISVSDNGPGIPAEDRSHIFDRFWHARRADKGGTGLGLAISEGIIRSHCGRLWVTSEEGKGAEFYFTIPRVNSVSGQRLLRREAAACRRPAA